MTISVDPFLNNLTKELTFLGIKNHIMNDVITIENLSEYAINHIKIKKSIYHISTNRYVLYAIGRFNLSLTPRDKDNIRALIYELIYFNIFEHYGFTI